MVLLLELPDDLVLAITVTWSAFLDVVHLDASLCCLKSRERFCNLAFEKGGAYPANYQYYEQIASVQDHFLHWALTRKARAPDIVVNETLLHNKKFRKRVLQQLGHRVLTIEMVDVSIHAPFVRTLNRILDSAQNNVPPGLPLSLAERLISVSRTAVDFMHPWRSTLNDICHFCPQIITFTCPPEFDLRAYTKVFTTWPIVVANAGMNDQAMGILTNNCKNLQMFCLIGYHTVSANALSKFVSQSGSALTSIRGIIRDPVGLGEVCAVVAATCPYLVEFRLRGHLTSLASFRALIVNCNYLQVLHLDGPTITDEVLAIVATMKSRLASLSVSSTTEITDHAVGRLVKKCTCLLTLEITHCLGISDMTATAIVENCIHLEDLTLREINITSQGVQAISFRFQPWYTLDLSYTSITDEELIVLMTQHRQLESLSITACSLITDSSLKAMGRLCKQLRVLHINGCSVTMVGIRAVAQGCSMLKTLQVTRRLHREMGHVQATEGELFSPKTLVVHTEGDDV